jgi:hypothetical protein
MLHDPRNSPVGHAIAREVEQLETDSDLNQCIVGNQGCDLSGGIEHLFVALTAHHVYRQAWMVEGNLAFQHVIYSPHTTVEGQGGFDLSVGHYKRPYRIRSMHKLLHAARPHVPWCDEEWTWSTADCHDNTHKHINSLISTYNQSALYEPYLILHVCYCLHEYRRMGTSFGQVTIPPFTDIVRTIIVDLRPVRDVADWENGIAEKRYAILVRHETGLKAPSAALVGPVGVRPLTVYDFGTYLKRFTELFKRVTEE